ncbi:hypothetical protein [Aureibacter tunicatorum]|uniref:Uncharacterized protein n=1 Tax=Aureibacter tunicatorum TaxID=866807 RepID=A0AAE3XS94_9BACT|nr:hypothetical protein [Aureibacter tunicatorum]MDR6241050.1 hypothetical protein [Aureibacter tunicatorum]BDD03828.1 hypothetical protein AUTU_13110 [Aureibacter tunicatorum]
MDGCFKQVCFNVLFLSFGLLSCQNESKSDFKSSVVDSGDDPNFKIEANDNSRFQGFDRKVEVFGISIFAVPKVENQKLLHAANVMAQYLDNDEDGKVDNHLVLDAMLENQAFMVMWSSEDDIDALELPDGGIGQDLGNDETVPDYVAKGKKGRFDASLEEVLHLITNAGYAYAYPQIFGEHDGSSLADAMDIARGGAFKKIPNQYPATAWFTYDDETCEYNCQMTEYIYWALTSILGAQVNRREEIDNEWKLYSREKVEETDKAIFALLTNYEYKFPTILPDGTYKR